MLKVDEGAAGDTMTGNRSIGGAHQPPRLRTTGAHAGQDGRTWATDRQRRWRE